MLVLPQPLPAHDCPALRSAVAVRRRCSRATGLSATGFRASAREGGRMAVQTVTAERMGLASTASGSLSTRRAASSIGRAVDF